MSEIKGTNQAEKEKRSLMADLSSTRDIILLNLKSIISNKMIFMMIIIFMLISIVPSLIFIPFWASGAMINLLGVIMPTLIVAGWIGSNVKNSTIYKNIRTNGFSRTTFHLAQLVTIIILANIFAIVVWTLIGIVGMFPVFLSGWVWEGRPRLTVNPLLYWEPVLLLYTTNVTALVVFATYFLIDSITSSSKNYNFIVVMLFIIGFIFGGSLNSYFYRPYNFEWISFINSGYTDGMSNFRLDTVYVEYWVYEATNGLEDLRIISNPNGIEVYGNMFPTTIFIPTLLNPFYAVGQFSTTAISCGMMQEQYWHLNQQIVIVDNLTNLNPIEGIDVMRTSTIDQIPILSWFHLGWSKETWAWSAVILQPFATLILYLLVGKSIQIAKEL